MGCKNELAHLKNCNCSYQGCSRKGICCECLTYHRSKKELPACYFPENIEKTYNRSIKKFVEINLP